MWKVGLGPYLEFFLTGSNLHFEDDDWELYPLSQIKGYPMKWHTAIRTEQRMPMDFVLNPVEREVLCLRSMTISHHIY